MMDIDWLEIIHCSCAKSGTIITFLITLDVSPIVQQFDSVQVFFPQLAYSQGFESLDLILKDSPKNSSVVYLNEVSLITAPLLNDSVCTRPLDP